MVQKYHILSEEFTSYLFKCYQTCLTLQTSITWFSLNVASTPLGDSSLPVRRRDFSSQISLWTQSLQCPLQIFMKNKNIEATAVTPDSAQFLSGLVSTHPKSPGEELHEAGVRQGEEPHGGSLPGEFRPGLCVRRNQHSVPLFRKEFSGQQSGAQN